MSAKHVLDIVKNKLVSAVLLCFFIAPVRGNAITASEVLSAIYMCVHNWCVVETESFIYRMFWASKRTLKQN